MGIISVTLPSDDTGADVSDYNTPLTTIVSELNGKLDEGNIDATANLVLNSISTDTITGKTDADSGTIFGVTTTNSVIQGGAAKGVSNASLDTTAGEPGGVWANYAAVLSGFLSTGQTLESKYTIIGKTVHVKINCTLGTSVTITGGGVTLPVTGTSVTAGASPCGVAMAYDASTTTRYHGIVHLGSTTTATPTFFVTSGAYSTPGFVSSSAPFAWTTGDVIAAFLNWSNNDIPCSPTELPYPCNMFFTCNGDTPNFSAISLYVCDVVLNTCSLGSRSFK